MTNKKKDDQRSLFTQSMVKKSMVALLKQRAINKITVSELCSEAGISRGTFYNHFYDVYDVYETIERDLTKVFVDKLSTKTAFSFDKKFLREIMLIIYLNIDLIRIVLANRNESSFFRDILAFIKEKFTKELEQKNPQIPKKHVEQLISYAVNGSLGMVSEWAESDLSQSPEEIAELAEMINSVIISTFFKK